MPPSPNLAASSHAYAPKSTASLEASTTSSRSSALEIASSDDSASFPVPGIHAMLRLPIHLYGDLLGVRRSWVSVCEE